MMAYTSCQLSGMVRAACLGIGLVIAAAPLSGAAAQVGSDWEAITAAAKREGRVVVYSSLTSPAVKNIAALFEKKTGIQVDVQYFGPSEVRERLRTELVAGRMVADVNMGGNTIRPLGSTLFSPHKPLPNARLVKAPMADDGVFIPTYIQAFALLINTSLVKPEDDPTQWADLLKPYWKGKMLVSDPRNPGAGNAIMTILRDRYGQGFLNSFVEQQPVLSRTSSINERRVAQGEFPIYVGFTVANIIQMQSLPVKAVVPTEGAIYNDAVAGLTAAPPRPNAGHLFLDFILSDEAQTSFADDGLISVTGQRSKGPLGDMTAGVKLLNSADPAKFDENMKIMEATFR